MAKKGNDIAKEERRDLMIRLLKECVNISPLTRKEGTASFKDLQCDKRPFKEIKKGKQKAVFTNYKIGILLEMLLRIDSEFNPAIYKAINIIKEDPYFGAAYDSSSQYNEKFQSCKYKKEYKKSVYCTCTLKMCNEPEKLAPLLKKEELEDLKYKVACIDCPIYKIYHALDRIENNTADVIRETAIKRNVFVRDQYKNNEEKIVESAYRTIMDYENVGNSYFETEGNSQTLFHNCKEVTKIVNVANAKMAYVKWYYGHLFTWPYFKKWYWQFENKENSRTSDYESMIVYEDEIYKQEMAAVSICLRLIEAKDSKLQKYTDLPCNAAIDKIVSCIYMNQYKSTDNLTNEYDSIMDECNKILNFPASDKAKTGLYIEMMNLSYYTRNNEKAGECENNIEELLHSGKMEDHERKLLCIRYVTYKYFYRKMDYIHMKKIVTGYNKALRRMSEYNDTAEMMKVAILYKSKFDYKGSDNPAITMKEFAGYDEEERIPDNVLGFDSDSRKLGKYTPSAYSRIYCEYYPNDYYYPGIKNQIKLL